jgi:hypothetical protein
VGNPANKDRRRGDIVEMRFYIEASRRGVIVSRPHDSARYDFIVDCGDRFWRVQVKSTTVKVWNDAYQLTIRSKHKKPYGPKDVDLIAGYVIPTKQWYIIPFSKVGRRWSVYLHPRCQYKQYLEAWHLLLNKDRNVKIDYMEASIDPKYCPDDGKRSEVARNPESPKQRKNKVAAAKGRNVKIDCLRACVEE